MPGLMDTIQGNLQGAATPAAPALGQTQLASNLLRTKLTGKETQPTSGPAQSAIGEALAQQQTKGGLQDIASQGKLSAEQLQQTNQDITQRKEIQHGESQQKLSDIQQQYSNKAQSILDNLESSGKELDTNQRLLQMQQAGFMLRHTNDNYVKELQRQGQLNRLNNSQSFKEQLARDIMDEQTALFKDDAQFQTAIKASGRDFTKALANMSDDFAIKMADQAMSNQSKQQIVSSIGGIIGAGVQAYGAYDAGQQNKFEQAFKDYNTEQSNAGAPLLTRSEFEQLNNNPNKAVG